VDTFGGLDVLVNNAGFIRGGEFVDTGEAEWDSVVRVHLKGHFATLHHAAQHLRGGIPRPSVDAVTASRA
jgi:NAD(P)-dependent dehydrogenase (short-subunit alcohol dehydrogenase family)